MRKLLLIIFLILACQVSAQKLKLRTTEVAFRTTDRSNNWNEWGEWQDTNVLIILDADNERITIFSKETQVYDIAKLEGQSKDDDNNTITKFLCVNEEGLKCQIRLMNYIDPNKGKQLYICFADTQWVYNVYKLD